MLLEKMLQSQGFGSRKYCQQLIKSGAVQIHGEAVDNLKYKADLGSWNFRYMAKALNTVKKFISP